MFKSQAEATKLGKVRKELTFFRTYCPCARILGEMPVMHSVKVDWFRILKSLNRLGYSGQQIADEIDVAKSTLLGGRQGAEPRHSSGEALIELWCSILSRERSQLPFITCKSRSMLRRSALFLPLQIQKGYLSFNSITQKNVGAFLGASEKTKQFKI